MATETDTPSATPKIAIAVRRGRSVMWRRARRRRAFTIMFGMFGTYRGMATKNSVALFTGVGGLC